MSSTVRAPNPTARRTASWLRASPTPRPLTASSTTTSSIQARTPVGILKTTSVSIPTIRPSSRQSRATSTVLAWASTISRIRSGVGKGALRDSCGIKRLKAATSSSSTLLAVATSIPPAEVEPIAVWLTHRSAAAGEQREPAVRWSGKFGSRSDFTIAQQEFAPQKSLIPNMRSPSAATLRSRGDRRLLCRGP